MLSLGQLFWLEAEVCRQFNDRLDPEFRFAGGMMHVHVRSPFLAREKVEPKPSDAQDRWTHGPSIAQREEPHIRMSDGKTSGATNEVGAPENRIAVRRTSPDAPGRNLHLVLGPVVTARCVPYTFCRKNDRCGQSRDSRWKPQPYQRLRISRTASPSQQALVGPSSRCEIFLGGRECRFLNFNPFSHDSLDPLVHRTLAMEPGKKSRSSRQLCWN